MEINRRHYFQSNLYSAYEEAILLLMDSKQYQANYSQVGQWSHKEEWNTPRWWRGPLALQLSFAGSSLGPINVFSSVDCPYMYEPRLAPPLLVTWGEQVQIICLCSLCNPQPFTRCSITSLSPNSSPTPMYKHYFGPREIAMFFDVVLFLKKISKWTLLYVNQSTKEGQRIPTRCASSERNLEDVLLNHT